MQRRVQAAEKEAGWYFGRATKHQEAGSIGDQSLLGVTAREEIANASGHAHAGARRRLKLAPCST